MDWTPGQPLELETEKYKLRSLTPDDADEEYTSWWNDAEVQRGFNNKPRDWDIPDAVKHIKNFNNITLFHLGIYPKDTSKLIGFITISVAKKHKMAITNVALGDKSYWGKDVIIEVRSKVVDFMFETLGIEKAESEILGRNFSSIFNNKVLGYTVEGILRKHISFVDGGRADKYLFGLTREDWQQAKDKKKKPAPKLDQKITNSEEFLKAKALLGEATHYDPKDIPDTASVDTWGAWDSLSHVRLLMAIEGHLGKELNPDIIVEISCVSDIAKFISDGQSPT